MTDKDPPRIYLAGPDVFRTDAVEIGQAKKGLCARYGFEGVFPMDPAPGAQARDEADPNDIYRVCVAHMERCNILIADMTPFRGPSMDVGTAFEMGFATARGMPIFGYSNVLGPYNERVHADSSYADPRPRDIDGLLIEEFGLQDNLMVSFSCSDSEVHLSLETALEAAAANFGR